MMDARFQTNAREVIAKIEHFVKEGGNPYEMLQDIGDSWVSRVQLGFRRQQGPGGRGWAPLKPSTLANRRGVSAKVLRDTGRLASSFSRTVSGASLSVGTNVKYAKTHQYGARKGAYGVHLARVASFRRDSDGATIPAHTRRLTVPWGDIPAREMLPLNKRLPLDWQNDMMDAAVYHLDKAAEGRPA